VPHRAAELIDDANIHVGQFLHGRDDVLKILGGFEVLTGGKSLKRYGCDDIDELLVLRC